jgi:ubiquinone biosynthesis protein
LDRATFGASIEDIFDDCGVQAVGEFDIAGTLTAITRIMHQYNVFMPSRLSMLIKCLIVLEGTAKGLHASFNLSQLLEPYRRQFVVEQLSPERWLRRANRQRHDWERLAASLPRSINGLLEQLRAGSLVVRNRHPPLETAVNRLAYGLCTSALLLASAMLWVLQAPPVIKEVSVLGAVGYVIAAILSTRLLWLIRRDKRKD